jgi:2-keto-3-deoxy-6-phosphogluconate aldolase
MKKEFHLGDVLSVITGRAISPTHMEGIMTITDYLMRREVSIIELPETSNKCRQALLEQFPQFTSINSDEITLENWESWLDEKVKVYGETLMVEPIKVDKAQQEKIEKMIDMLFA